MSQMQFAAPPFRGVNKIIIITTGVFFLAGAILKAIGALSLVSYLGLSGADLFHGHIYQLITYPFMETQFMSMLFNCLLVWMIGSDLEAQWGQRVYLRFLGMIVLTVGIIFSLVTFLFFYGTTMYGSPLHGLNGINFALLVAYATLFPQRQMSLMMIFPVQAKVFCWILVGIEAYMAIFSSFMTSWAHLLAMGLSYLIIQFQGRPLFQRIFRPAQKKSVGSIKKGHLYVVKDDEKTPPKYWQ